MSTPDVNGWIKFDSREDPGTSNTMVDLWLTLSGRLTDCVWASGRKCWIRTTKHGVEEILTTPSHWRHVPAGPAPIAPTDPQGMDIDAPKGTKVVFADRNGHDSDRTHANKFLSKGFTYTVESTDVHSFSSTVELQEYPGEEFNTVMFWDAATMPGQ